MPTIDGSYTGGGYGRALAHDKVKKAMAATEKNAGEHGAQHTEESHKTPAGAKKSVHVHEMSDGTHEVHAHDHQTGKHEVTKHENLEEAKGKLDEHMGGGAAPQEEHAEESQPSEHAESGPAGSSLGLDMEEEA